MVCHTCAQCCNKDLRDDLLRSHCHRAPGIVRVLSVDPDESRQTYARCYQCASDNDFPNDCLDLHNARRSGGSLVLDASQEPFQNVIVIDDSGTASEESFDCLPEDSPRESFGEQAMQIPTPPPEVSNTLPSAERIFHPSSIPCSVLITGDSNVYVPRSSSFATHPTYPALGLAH